MGWRFKSGDTCAYGRFLLTCSRDHHDAIKQLSSNLKKALGLGWLWVLAPWVGPAQLAGGGMQPAAPGLYCGACRDWGRELASRRLRLPRLERTAIPVELGLASPEPALRPCPDSGITPQGTEPAPAELGSGGRERGHCAQNFRRSARPGVGHLCPSFSGLCEAGSAALCPLPQGRLRKPRRRGAVPRFQEASCHAAVPIFQGWPARPGAAALCPSFRDGSLRPGELCPSSQGQLQAQAWGAVPTSGGV